jgi:hypothetical protein
MFDLNSVIGLEAKDAENVLLENGYKNIIIVLNSKHNDKCDTKIVCSVRRENDEVTLVCGEFYVDIKEK